MPQTPSGGGSSAPPMSPSPCPRMSIKDLRSRVSATASRTSALSKGGLVRFIKTPTDSLAAPSWQTDCGACVLMSLSNGNVTSYGKVMSRLPAILDSIEIGPPGLPVIRVLGQLDALVRLVFDKFERAGADRVLAHLRRADMARIDRRIAGGEQGQQRRLRLLQMQCRLGGAIDGRLLDVDPPALAIVEAL